MLISLEDFMKKTVVTIFLAILMALSFSALELTLPVLQSDDTASAAASAASDADAGIIEDMAGFHGFTAYNVLNGTSEKIQATDRQVFVFRNSSGGPSGYNPASSKRLSQNGIRCFYENIQIHHMPGRYTLSGHNSDILYRGMSSNSERIHFLRVLIV